MSDYPIIEASTGARAIRKYVKGKYKVKKSGSKYVHFSVLRVEKRGDTTHIPLGARKIWYEIIESYI